MAFRGEAVLQRLESEPLLQHIPRDLYEMHQLKLQYIKNSLKTFFFWFAEPRVCLLRANYNIIIKNFLVIHKS